MDVSGILAGLNGAQREAVTHEARIVRVIAGAGSGKTRVLIHRLLWLMQVEGLAPYQLLALTFTNKAAREMRQRLEQQLGQSLGELWMGTFHGICYRILRRHAEKTGWSNQFAVMDSEDQLALIRRMMRDMNWSDETIAAQDLRAYINARKEEGLRAADVAVKMPQEIIRRDFYAEYERVTKARGRMDFAELQLLCVELLEGHEAVRESFRRRFQVILVDEFQDTNSIQMRLISLLLAPQNRLFVVGDDDQSIYSWRGARVENMLEMEQRFPDEVGTVRLEQNYRSSQTILSAANALIAENANRLGKTLWTESGEGEAITVYPAYNEYDEAEYVAAQIALWLQGGGNLRDCAVLYRSNAISRVFEKVLTGHQIPYRVYGGLRFFERAEIKDALAYLRLSIQPDDDSAFERVVNMPARGVGNKTLEDLRQLARQGNLSFWQLLQDQALLKRHLSARAANALLGFRALIEAMAAAIGGCDSLKAALNLVLERSGLYQLYKDSDKEDAVSRLENLQELVSAAAYADMRFAGEGIEERAAQFLADAALEAGDNEADAEADAVQLMTMHSAKGLEFPLVFIAACEENVFPHFRAMDNPKALEEERRLAYVAVTRAMQKLVISFAERRRLQGSEHYPDPSRYIQDIPQELLHCLRPVVFNRLYRSAVQEAPPPGQGGQGGAAFAVGTDVQHAKFGEGTIIALEGRGEHQRALVRFGGEEKWLVLAYAKLSRIGG